MRAIGASDAFIYFTSTGPGNTMEIRMDVVLSRPVAAEQLRQAADGALALFPEFSVRLVTRGGHLMYQENHAPVRVYETDAPKDFAVTYCTQETNGHVLWLLLDKNDPRRFSLCCLHGMSDFAGIFVLLKTLLYRLRLLLEPGFSATEEELRAAKIRTAVPEKWDAPERLDPYMAYGTAPQVPAAAPETPFAVQGLPLYEPTDGRNHNYDITLSTSAFLAKSRELKTSFAPLLVSLLTDAVADCFDAGEEKIIASLPVDMRAVFGADTVVNFSDGVLLPLSAEQRSLPVAEQCALVRAELDAQRTREFLAPALYGKARSALAMAEGPYAETAARVLEPVLTKAPRKVPMTYVMTYPGRLDMPAPLAGLVTWAQPRSVQGRVRFFFLISTYGDEMTIQVCQRYDGDALPLALAEAACRLGLKSVMTDRGTLRQSCLDPARLEEVATN